MPWFCFFMPVLCHNTCSSLELCLSDLSGLNEIRTKYIVVDILKFWQLSCQFFPLSLWQIFLNLEKIMLLVQKCYLHDCVNKRYNKKACKYIHVCKTSVYYFWIIGLLFSRITLGGFFPNCLYHFVNADFIGSAEYHSNYY